MKRKFYILKELLVENDFFREKNSMVVYAALSIKRMRCRKSIHLLKLKSAPFGFSRSSRNFFSKEKKSARP